jgi:LPS sulfotransferase NodH
MKLRCIVKTDRKSDGLLDRYDDTASMPIFLHLRRDDDVSRALEYFRSSASELMRFSALFSHTFRERT